MDWDRGSGSSCDTVQEDDQSQYNITLHHGAGFMETHVTLCGCLSCLAMVNACPSSKLPVFSPCHDPMG